MTQYVDAASREDPFLLGRPDAITSFENKWSDPDFQAGVSQLQAAGLAPSTLRALARLDATRAAVRGQRPLSQRESFQGLVSALQNRPVTPEPKPGLFTRAINDLRDVVTTIPQMLNPNLEQNPLVHELTAIGTLPDALAAAKSPVDVLRAPGIRLLPGTYTAANVLENPSIGALTTHPLLTALDVAPYAKPLAKATRAAAVESPTLARLRTAAEPYAVRVRGNPMVQTLGQVRGRLTREVAKVESSASQWVNQRRNARSNIPLDPTDFKGQFGRAGDRLADDFKITQARREEVSRVMRQDRAAARAMVANDPVEAAWLEAVLDLTDMGTAIGTGEIWARNNLPIPEDIQLRRIEFRDPTTGAITTEVYPTKVADRITKARNIRDQYAQGVAFKEFVANPTANAPIANFVDFVTSATNRRALESRAVALRSAMELVGYETADLNTALTALRKTKANKIQDLIPPMEQAFADAFAKGRTSMVDIPDDALIKAVGATSRQRPNDLMFARLHEAMYRRDWSRANEIRRGIVARTGLGVIPELSHPDLIGSIARKISRDNLLSRLSGYTPEYLGRMDKRVASIEARSAPARFDDVIERHVQERFAATMANKGNLSPEDLAQGLDDLSRGAYSRVFYEDAPPPAPPGTRVPRTFTKQTANGPREVTYLEEFRNTHHDVRRTWQSLKAQGVDPVYMHRVSGAQVNQLIKPRVLEVLRNPTQYRERVGEVTPFIEDPNVALSHQGVELLAYEASEEMVAQIWSKWGRTRQQLEDDYHQLAVMRAAKDTRKSYRAHLEELIGREWTPYAPKDIITWKSPRIGSLNMEQSWVPKNVKSTLERMHKPGTTKLTALPDKLLNVFRTSILALSPRWHFYNIMGGGVMLMARTDPTVFRYLAQARRMLSEGIDGNLARELGLQQGMGSVGAEVVAWNKAGRFTHQWKAGNTLREWANSVVDKSFNFNQTVDDMYRVMAYLHGSKGGARGGTNVAMREAGINLSRKILQQWDTMTPIERTVMRYVFPFYGWMGHLLKYTMTYPWDHPYRVAVLGSFARAEVDDWETTLPQRLKDLLFLGQPDENGEVSTFNVGGINPFADVANLTTTMGFMFGGEADFAGFVGSLNPAIAAGLQAMGIDPINGSPSLYPDVRYDPVSGRLTTQQKSPIWAIASGIIPQSRILSAMFGANSEYAELLRTNPEAAQRMLRGAAGLPIFFRDVNVPEEQIKAEVARDTAMRDTLADALRTGNWAEAIRKYPSLAPRFDMIREMMATEEGQAYRPTQVPGGSGSTLATLRDAIVSGNLPGVRS